MSIFKKFFLTKHKIKCALLPDRDERNKTKWLLVPCSVPFHVLAIASVPSCTDSVSLKNIRKLQV